MTGDDALCEQEALPLLHAGRLPNLLHALRVQDEDGPSQGAIRIQGGP
jgi:hypothetical protein